MIIKGNIKYACETCIKGHRVATCNHSDRPLIEIKRKGRPSTACFHCKELRMVRNVNPSGSCKCHSKKATSTCGCLDGNPCKCHTQRKRSQPKHKDKSLGIKAETLPNVLLDSNIDDPAYHLGIEKDFMSPPDTISDISTSISTPFDVAVKSPGSYHNSLVGGPYSPINNQSTTVALDNYSLGNNTVDPNLALFMDNLDNVGTNVLNEDNILYPELFMPDISTEGEAKKQP